MSNIETIVWCLTLTKLNQRDNSSLHDIRTFLYSEGNISCSYSINCTTILKLLCTPPLFQIRIIQNFRACGAGELQNNELFTSCCYQFILVSAAGENFGISQPSFSVFTLKTSIFRGMLKSKL